MKIHFYLRFAVLVSIVFCSTQSWSLNVEEFQQYCAKPNSQSVFCQSYIGGALDAIAVMNDEARRKGHPLYCVHEKEVFDMDKMTELLLMESKDNYDKNAIYPLVKYLKTVGQCGEQ